MARRYGQKSTIQRKWKKISRMNLKELDKFRVHLEKNKAQFSKVYDFVMKRTEYLEWKAIQV